MQCQVIARPCPAGVPVGRGAALQRSVIRALLSDPREEGVEVEALASALDHSPDDLATEIELLEFVGLVHRSGSAVRASSAAMHFGELWRGFR